jgi:hypothetical protein
MSRLSVSQVVSFPRISPNADEVVAGVISAQDHPSLRGVAAQSIELLRARCKAAEDAARAAGADASRARAELLRTRQVCQEMLDASVLEVLQLKRELQARDEQALHQSSRSESPAVPQPTDDSGDDEIPFHKIEAALAATPLCS